VDERSFLEVISGRRRGWPAGLMRVGLTLLTPAYGGGVGLRNWMFDTGLLRTHSVPVPVISVGNLTTGGTGKTPLVAWIAELCLQCGRRPCIISRGYRALDSRGNDEQRVLQQLCPVVPQVQNRDRVAAARAAMSRHQADVLVLDDGFQHRRLARALDIVLIDALKPWGFGRLLPRGLLREPARALRRADLVILTRVDQVAPDSLADLRARVRDLTEAPLAEVEFRPTGLVTLDGEQRPVASLRSCRLSAFCGIGNPRGFELLLESAGLRVDSANFRTFADHHHYTPDEVRQLQRASESAGSAALVTTLKDLVKISPEWCVGTVMAAVVIGATFVAGGETVERLVECAIGETPAANAG
jgi:tetraacyldisaccharide 4'-kinase